MKLAAITRSLQVDLRSRRGRFRAIPTENVPRKGTDGKWIRALPGAPVRSAAVCASTKRTIAPGCTASAPPSAGKPASSEGFGVRPTTPAQRTGSTTVVMFLLAPQVQLRKRLGVAPAAERWSAQLPNRAAA